MGGVNVLRRPILLPGGLRSRTPRNGIHESSGLARIIHERFCCNCGFAAATSLSAGGLAARSVNILFKNASLTSRLRAPVSRRDSTISRRTVKN